MKKFLFLIIAIQSFAINIADINKAIANKEYSKVCNNSIYDIAIKNKDDGLLNLYAIACLKSDYINKLSAVIIALRNSKEARANAVYYSTILYKKKLLHSALVDGLNINAIKLPKCDYILSDIYDDYISQNYTKQDDKYIFSYNDKIYELSLKEDKPFTKMVVKIKSLNNEILDVKEYW
ncbi:hypothetical protein AVANS14531_06875 [Campylobacter sp. Cr9]|uniref:hypothetical protein n=1 Tax=unclassified Campylobacter TaxID=2593542 RepID=UPI001EFBE621|nr:hypothetical protein [Campylobacter sp. RM5004]MBZ7986054.1 hypothetical protein [Campylobacter sp. Cr9]ULO01837.1 hypothetical protein AVANS_1218 [Campylobacter sp. RM5004]